MCYSIDDPYTYPDSSVLRNIAGLRERQALDFFEANAVSRRLIELELKPSFGKFDTGHLKAIHRNLFQDVYAWAGTFRTVNLARSGQTMFAHFDQLEQFLDGVFRKLASEQHLKNLKDPSLFAERAAFYMGEINAAHPFREGNGLTQREFIHQLATQAGFTLSWESTDRAALYKASSLSFITGNGKPLADLLLQALISRK